MFLWKKIRINFGQSFWFIIYALSTVFYNGIVIKKFLLGREMLLEYAMFEKCGDNHESVATFVATLV